MQGRGQRGLAFVLTRVVQGIRPMTDQQTALTHNYPFQS